MSGEEKPSVEIMPSMQLLAEAAQEQEKLPEHDTDVEGDDDRSSSLSELEDRAGTEASDDPDAESSDGEDEEQEVEQDEEDDGDENEDDVEGVDRVDAEEVEREEDEDVIDTEAETERLQESPEKRRPSRALHLRASDVLKPPPENLDQTSEISALSDSEPEGMSNLASIISSPRKRKRGEHETDDEDTTERSLKKVSRKLEDHVNNDDEDRKQRNRIIGGKDDDEDVSDEEHASSKEPTPEREVDNQGDDKDEEGSVADEAEAEAEGADGEAETTAKSEEDAVKKEAALSELRAIEKDFALLRDKLFAEKSQKLNEELELLRKSPNSHSEFAVAAATITRRRDDQKQLALSQFEHNIRNLQKICIAERTMAHCQYMQEVRESREKALDQAGHEWYRIQRERRRAEEDGSEKRHHYNKDRAVQIAAQQAYNREVSILSGIHKYIGFPAAPQIEGVPESDKADDLKKMGISTKPVHNVPISAPISSFPRQQPRADETFLERNPWANPAQVYGVQAVNPPPQPQQQPAAAPTIGSALFTTPAHARRQTEPQTQNSASTIAVSSVEQTPMSNQAQMGSIHRPQLPQSDGPTETPSRNAPSRPELSITDASPTNGTTPRNGLATHGATNGLNGLAVSKAAEEISPRSSPLKTAQAQVVSAGSS